MSDSWRPGGKIGKKLRLLLVQPKMEQTVASDNESDAKPLALQVVPATKYCAGRHWWPTKKACNLVQHVDLIQDHVNCDIVAIGADSTPCPC